jgi:sugar (pentulose or hexulose) kinase
MQMKLLGIDIGTTHCKAGLFRADGTAVSIAKQATQARRSPAGYAYYDPEALWQSVVANISEVTNSVPAGQIGAIGVTSMAETGLLLDLATEQPRTPLIPWFDTGATAQAERLEATGDPLVAFRRSGIQPNFKCGLAKILWLREALGADLKGARWLGMADYIVYRLTGAWVTDYSLAGRTYAFDIASKQWDDAWLASFDVSADIFPEALPATETAGRLIPAVAAELGLAAGTPVSVAGHDHVCAAFVGAALQPGQVFDSMGTAEVLTGALPERPLNRRDFRSGLSYGCHVAPGYHYWMGGLSASGGSLSWLRSVLGDPPLTNDELMALSKEQGDGPGEILYFPYLAGSGSPHTDMAVRGAFVGLSSDHGRGDLLQAVLEGTAYEMEMIRRMAEYVTGLGIDSIMAAGGGAVYGGAANRHWLQIKADVSNCTFRVPAWPEVTLLGAALLGGIGAGVYSGAGEALAGLARGAEEVIDPDCARHERYRDLFEYGYEAFQGALRHHYHSLQQVKSGNR